MAGTLPIFIRIYTICFVQFHYTKAYHVREIPKQKGYLQKSYGGLSLRRMPERKQAPEQNAPGAWFEDVKNRMFIQQYKRARPFPPADFRLKARHYIQRGILGPMSKTASLLLKAINSSSAAPGSAGAAQVKVRAADPYRGDDDGCAGSWRPVWSMV
ncbi:MAG: hypothetical protein ACLRX2_12405 [Oscillospiraceae bacterium]